MSELIKSATLIDVRTHEEYSDGHFPNAINVPLDQIANRINEFKEMQKPIVTYCKSGNRSGMAISILKQNGIIDAVNAGSLYDLKQLSK